MVDRPTIYSTPWCGYCKRLKTQMQREGIEFDEVDIEADAAAEQFVLRANNGMALVPTLAFPDGSSLSNPSLADVKARLQTIG